MKDPERVRRSKEATLRRKGNGLQVGRLPGFKVSPETIRKREETKRLKRESGLMKLTVKTQEQIKLMSENAKKLWQTPEYREKVIASHKLYVPTQQTKDKQSKSTIGRKKPKEFGEKISKAKIGHFVSSETKKKQSISKKQKYDSGELDHVKEISRQTLLGKEPWNKGLKYFQTEEAKIAVAKGKEKAWSDKNYKTVPEIKTKEILEKYNIKFKEQFRIDNKIYDFYLQDYNMLIEIDGIYWHSREIRTEQLKKGRLDDRLNDIYKNNLAIEKGYTLIRIWEDELWKLECLCKNNFTEIEDLYIDEENYDRYLKIA